MTIKQLKQAVQDYFGDTSRSPEETLNDLEGLIEDTEGYCEAIREGLED